MTEKNNIVNVSLNTIDEDKNPIKINLKLIKHNNNVCEAHIYDSRMRHFYSLKLHQTFDYYFDLLYNNKLSILYESTYDIMQEYVGEHLLIYIAGGGINDSIGLIENKESHNKLKDISKKIRVNESKLRELKMEEYKLKNLYP